MPASFFSRISACVVDMMIILLASLPFIFSCLIIAEWSQTDVGYILALLVAQICISGVIAVYYTTTMRRNSFPGQTWGKQLLNIKTLNLEDTELQPKIIVYRELIVKYWLFMLLSGALFFLPLVVNALFIVFHPENKSLHDIVTHTKIIKTA